MGIAIVLLSKSSVKSNWVQNEINAAKIREIESRDTIVLPGIIEAGVKAEIPEPLRNKRYANFCIDFESALFEVHRSISAIALGKSFSKYIPSNRFLSTKIALSSKLGFNLGKILIASMGLIRLSSSNANASVSLFRELITRSRSTQLVAHLLELSNQNQNDLKELRNLIIVFFETQNDSDKTRARDEIATLASALNPMLQTDIKSRHGSEPNKAFSASFYVIQGSAIFLANRLGATLIDYLYNPTIHEFALQCLNWFSEFCSGMKASPLPASELIEYVNSFKMKELDDRQLLKLIEFISSWPSRVYTYFCPPKLLHEYSTSSSFKKVTRDLLSDILDLSKYAAMRGENGEQLFVEKSDPNFSKSQHWIRHLTAKLNIPVDIVIDGAIIHKDASPASLDTQNGLSEPTGETPFGWSIVPRIGIFLDCMFGFPAKGLFNIGFNMRQISPILEGYYVDGDSYKDDKKGTIENSVISYYRSQEKRFNYIKLIKTDIFLLRLFLPTSSELLKNYQNAVNLWSKPQCSDYSILAGYKFFSKELYEGLIAEIDSKCFLPEEPESSAESLSDSQCRAYEFFLSQ